MTRPTVRDGVRTLADRILSAEPVTALGWGLVPGDVRVLAYHDVPDADRFESHLQVIASQTNPLTLDEFIRAVRDGTPLPQRAALITFDDGDVSVRHHALPLLRAHALPSVCFVVSGLVDSNEPYWWIEVREHLRGGVRVPSGYPHDPERLISRLKQVPDSERRRVVEWFREHCDHRVTQENLTSEDLLVMEGSGMSIESHSVTHPCLDRCTEQEIEGEVVGSRSRLGEIVGRPLRALAYPNGNHDERVRAATGLAGYLVGFLFDHSMTRLTQPPYALSRLRISSSASTDRLEAVLSGTHPAIHGLRRSYLPPRGGSM